MAFLDGSAVYTGTDGRSHVQNIALNAESVMEEVTGMRVRVSPPGSFSDLQAERGPQQVRDFAMRLQGADHHQC